MNEREITICGHGSNTPSLKNMYEYLENRYNTYTTNSGRRIRKEIKSVKRLKALTDRAKFHDTYKTILGRNKYDQNLRNYCYKPYKDGTYRSDCSSSGCLTFKEIGLNCPTYNCAGIYTSELFEDVPVVIKNGHITNPEVLKVGDALLFAGATAGRPLDISHVEYIYEMPNKDGWVKDGDKWYYYQNGVMLKKEWIKYKSKWYRVGNDGAMLTDWHQIYDKDGNLGWYYFDKDGALWHETDKRDGSLEVWVIKED